MLPTLVRASATLARLLGTWCPAPMPGAEAGAPRRSLMRRVWGWGDGKAKGCPSGRKRPFNRSGALARLGSGSAQRGKRGQAALSWSCLGARCIHLPTLFMKRVLLCNECTLP
jgi:hypothetical protein